MLLLHWSPVTISETRQGCDQNPVPCADLQPSSHPGASPCRHAHLVSLCPGCSIRPHSESLSETQPFRVLHAVRSPSLETWRNCSPHRAHCSWEHPLHCFVSHFFSSAWLSVPEHPLFILVSERQPSRRGVWKSSVSSLVLLVRAAQMSLRKWNH